MNRVVFVSVVILCLLSVSSISGLIQVAKADGGTITINADGSMSPSTAPIYTADNATYTLTGNIIAVSDGIVIDRDNIVLNGAGYTVTGGNSSSSDGIALTDMSNVTVRNLTIKNFTYGIWLYSSSNCTLSGNNVTANSVEGIELGSYSSNNSLSGNNIANNGEGIALYASSGNTLSGNNVTANLDYGIYLESCSGNTLSDNVMVGNEYNFGVLGTVFSDFLQSIDASNLVDGKPLYYFVNQSNMIVNPDAYPEVGFLGFVGCVNVTVQGMNLTNNGQGLLLAYTNDSKITGNNIADNKLGIDLEFSSSNTLSGNNVTNDYDGQIAILLTDSCNNNTISGNALIDLTGTSDGINLENSCNDNIISGNVVTANVTGFGVGIVLMESCNNNTISDNSAVGSGQGIFLEDSSNSNSISGNNVAANELEGICLDSCDSNDISGNNITGNQNYGISLGSCSNNTLSGNNVANNLWGICLDSSSNNNTIYHNNFINNTSQVPPFFSGGTNVWDNGSVGNYWSDYLTKYPNATETNSSGVWNTPYVIGANNTDYYPLTVPIAVVPEFPLIQATMLFMMATLLAVVIYKKKVVKTRQSSARARTERTPMKY